MGLYEVSPSSRLDWIVDRESLTAGVAEVLLVSGRSAFSRGPDPLLLCLQSASFSTSRRIPWRVLLGPGELLFLLLGDALELVFLVIMPVLVGMMMATKFLEIRGALEWLAKSKLAKALEFVGLPTLGVMALVQIQFVSFAAPVSSLRELEKDARDREIASTLAMVLSMAQMNATFPLIRAGLTWWIVPISIGGGILAAGSSYYFFFPVMKEAGKWRVWRFFRDLFGRSARKARELREQVAQRVKRVFRWTVSRVSRVAPVVLLELLRRARGTVDVYSMRLRSFLKRSRDRLECNPTGEIFLSGIDGFWTSVRTFKFVLLGLFLVHFFDGVGLVELLGAVLSPFLRFLNFPGEVSLLLMTKYFAGGSAMMGASLELIREGALDVAVLDRCAGFVINPCDVVGLPVLLAAGPRVRSVLAPALGGWLVGVVVRGCLHAVFL